MDRTLDKQIKFAIEASLSTSQTPGAAVAVRLNGEALVELGIGDRDLNRDRPMPADASFYIYSVTKTLLAIATLDLVDRGVLDLDRSIQTYLPDLALDPTITLRHLLSHTSGLPDYAGMSDYVDAVKTTPTKPRSTAAFLNLATHDLRFLPGRGWEYSNLGYLIVKCVLERVTTLPIQQLLARVIFHPLALQKTFVPTTLEDVTDLTPGYTTFFGSTELQDMTALYHPGWVAHGVVVSTAPELAQTIEALFRHQILSSELIARMRHPAHILGKYPLFERLAYGLGLFIDLDSPYGMASGHTGEGPGYSVAAFYFPQVAGSGVSIAAVMNRDGSDYGLMLVSKLVEIVKNFLEHTDRSL